MNFNHLAGIADKLGLSVVGEPVTLVAQERTVQAIFDNPNSDGFSGKVPLGITQPQLTLPESSLSGLKGGDHIRVESTQEIYSAVWPPHKGGSGMVVLRLAPIEDNSVSTETNFIDLG